MEKKYSPLNFEADNFKRWKNQKLYQHQNQIEKENFSIILPPPNVTGSLHLGHAWDGTIQDAIIRFKKLNGFNTYWVAGKDHAGIASQTTFEKYLKSINQSRTDFTREEFIEELKKWVQKNSNEITSQWEKMGFLLDYDHQKFTLDDEVSQCVNDTFKSMYQKGLVYKKLALVNWDVKLQTAVSDIEVIRKEVNQKMYTIKYQLENSNQFLSVSTTRPETMFVDTCLIVNPKDSRYSKYIGQKVINPANDQLIEVISDYYVDLEYGTGVMKCTPAHDFNDYKIGNKYHQKYLTCMNFDGTMNQNAGEFIGVDRLECRKLLVEKLTQRKALISIDDHQSAIGYSERTNEIIEPLLSEQWFIAMELIAKDIIEEQKSSKGVEVFPKHFNNTLIKWLENIQDWCISRQLWWGHQIPAWYHKTTDEIVVEDPKDSINYFQDESVFDTWFSSSLWPFVTLGQNTNQKEYDLFFPTNVLVTAYDIIFFWVARMMMVSKYVTQKIPFKHLFIHGLIRDDKGQKLSKSLGNFVDLFDLCNKFGVDALRLFLLSNSTIGQDLIYQEEKVNSASNFLNKLWNIAVFVDLNHQNLRIEKISKQDNPFDLWMLHKTKQLAAEFHHDFDNYNYVVGIKKLVDFVKNDFSGTYIDLNRTRIGKDDDFIKTTKTVLKAILIMLHPICCFVTEEIYQNIYQDKPSILLELWPEIIDCLAQKEIDDSLLILENIRTFKWNYKLSKKDEVKITIYHEHKIDLKTINEIVKIENPIIDFKFQKFSNQLIDDSKIVLIVGEFVLVYDAIINVSTQEQKKQLIEDLKFEISRSEKMLANSGFVKKAPKIMIEKENAKLLSNINKLAEFLK